MLKVAANITLLFPGLPWLDRFSAAREAGFKAVEMMFPYHLPTQDIQNALADNGLAMVLINTPVPDWDDGGRGCAAQPGRQKMFRKQFRKALDYANSLSVRHIHVMAGNTSGALARNTLIDNLVWATETAPEHSLTIEPLNSNDFPGYFLNSFDQARDILETVAAPNLGLQFDAYHAHRITGDVLKAWGGCRDLAVHIQVAGAEGRHEPVDGAIDYGAFFRQIRQDQYQGYVSGEYHPRTATGDGLAWIDRLMAPS